MDERLPLDEMVQQQENLRASGAAQLIRAWNALDIAWYTLDWNASEILKLHEALNNRNLNRRKLWDDHETMSWLFADACRHFHNFLAAASSLVEHSRNHRKRFYSEHSFGEEWQLKVAAELASAPTQRLVQGLRNYNLHRKLPIEDVSHTVHLDGKTGGQTEKAFFVLRRDSLLEWDGWDAIAKDYLLQSSAHIDVSSVINDYLELVRPFHQWRQQKEEQINSQAMQDLSHGSRVPPRAVRPVLRSASRR
ncbi:MAG: hypothetical protein WEB00_11375 [Dehalococcoidia bacterium]